MFQISTKGFMGVAKVYMPIFSDSSLFISNHFVPYKHLNLRCDPSNVFDLHFQLLQFCLYSLTFFFKFQNLFALTPDKAGVG